MTGEIIKSFLVGLGFDVDESSLAKFNKSIQSASLRVAALYTSVKLAASAITYSISKISEGFEQMGYEYRIISPMINKTLMLRRELLKAYAAAGVNITKVIQSSVKLNFSLAKTRFAFEAIYRSVGSRFFDLLTKQSDIFRDKLYKNMPKIQAVLEKFVNFIFKAFAATVTLGERAWSILGRLYDFFVRLDQVTDGWSTVILGAVAAWKLLNLEFLATPLGLIITGLTAILALYDDFKTFQEGGKSLFDWSSFIPTINATKIAMSAVFDVLKDAFNIAGELVDSLVSLFNLDFSGFLGHLDNAVGGLVDQFFHLISALDKLLTVGDVLFPWLSKLFGGNAANAAANVSATPLTTPNPSPVGSQVQNSQTNQNVQMQTQISVSGSADANATGNAVMAAQARNNFDFARNLKGAVKPK